MNRKIYSIFCTSLGWGSVVASEKGLIEIILPLYTREQIRNILRGRYEDLKRDQWELKLVVDDIKDYFRGREIIATYPLDLGACSAFQRRVYKIVSSIPYGEVRTYRWVAKKLGQPFAARAVGKALARNPLPLLIPCHRVIKSDGTLGGFSAPGGIGLKKMMLKIEAVM